MNDRKFAYDLAMAYASVKFSCKIQFDDGPNNSKAPKEIEEMEYFAGEFIEAFNYFSSCIDFSRIEEPVE